MTDKLLMALDLGTSFIKSGVYNLNGDCLATASEPVKDERPEAGVFIQHGEDLYRSVINCIRSVTDALGSDSLRIAAISFTGQMAGFMGVGDNWEDITGWSCSLDTRYAPYAEKQLKALKGDFLKYCGTTSPLFSSKYEWFESDFPEEARRIRKYLMLNGYILGRLGDTSVNEAAIDATLLTWTGFADVGECCWSSVIGDKLNVDPTRLPNIMSSIDIASHLSQSVAEELGLAPGIPLIVGAGDKMAGCVGAGILEPGDMIFEAASFGGLSAMVNEYRPDFESEHYDCISGVRAGDMYAHYYIPGSGITLDWFVNQFIKKDGQKTGEAFANINARMNNIPPGCDGLMAVGMLSGTVMPFDGDLKGIWLGFDWSHRPEHFFKALIESHGFALSTAMDQIEKNYPEYAWDRVVIIGGGAKSPEQTQIFADVCGKEFVTIDREDAALWGTCILAAKGIGLIDDMLEFAREHRSIKAVYKPNKSNFEKYQHLKEQYNRYEKELSPFCRDRIM